MKLCYVCMQRPRTGALFCDPCRRSYDRDARADETFYAAIIWAAKRARRYERARKGKKR